MVTAGTSVGGQLEFVEVDVRSFVNKDINFTPVKGYTGAHGAPLANHPVDTQCVWNASV